MLLEVKSAIFLVSIGLVLELINPFLIRNLIKWIELENPIWWVGILYSLAMGFLSHTKVYLYRRGIYTQSVTENHMSSIIRQVIFDKILSIPTTSLNMIDFGMISTMITNDEMTLEIFMYFSIVGTSSLIVLIPNISILAYYYGWYFLFAPFWIILLVIIQTFIGSLTKKLVIKRAKYNDGLGLMANEMVKGIKNIKFNVWEKVSENKIMTYRRGETMLNSIYYIYNFVAVHLGTLIPSCMIACIYILSLRSGKTIELAEVYFLVSLCSTLVHPSVTIVKSINFYIRAMISLDRIQNFVNVEVK